DLIHRMAPAILSPILFSWPSSSAFAAAITAIALTSELESTGFAFATGMSSSQRQALRSRSDETTFFKPKLVIISTLGRRHVAARFIHATRHSRKDASS